MGVVIESRRNDRTLAWSLVEFGEEPLTAACRRLAGDGRTYASKFAKAHRASPLKTLAETPAPEALDRIREIPDALGEAW